MSAALAIRGLTKRFGAVQALTGVDLDLAADELLVLLGPTGAGKTTLLRCIAGLEAPDAGSITLGGVDAVGLSPAQRDVALVFQNFSLYPDWTVGENIAFPLRAPGRAMGADAIRERVAWAARMLRLTDYLDRPASRLSGGQMQRVAIGRAIVRRPRLFLMDEPLTNLDAKLRESLRVELAVLRRELKTPMLYVTHDQAEALSMGDRVAVLDGGRILQQGEPRAVYERPVSPAVARLVGLPRINLLPAEDAGGGWTAGGVAIVPRAAGDPAGRCLLGIRPEDLRLAGGSAPAEVQLVEHLGAALLVTLRWAGMQVQALVGKDAAVRRGDTVHPAADPGRTHRWSAAD
ncbi:MAG: ABC transporter ATP-binding protein [Planctomycetes bacterium]|nr:ABC transporter ATP-binding protein [Planctomycetota bacterium]